MGFSFMDYYNRHPLHHGIWILILEIVICGVLPALILISKKGRASKPLFMTAIVLAVIGVCLNRWVMVMTPMAMPVMSFDSWVSYFPSWQEIATTILPFAGGIMVVAMSYRYLPVFPQEKELNPVD
jgi:molybdopterin-containing oxidoreductase family membrane subunit